MSDFSEIFGSSKLNLNSDLRVRICLEDAKLLNSDSELGYDVDEEAQFVSEKAESNKFNFYATISPSLNLRFLGGDKPNYDYFKFNEQNWQIVLLKPTSFYGDKGKKNFIKKDIHEYDFNYGLPCLKVIPKQEELKNYMSFNCYFGHNFNVDDRVYITSLDTEYIQSGYFNVIGIDGNSVSINNEYTEVIPDYVDDSFTTGITIDEQANLVANNLLISTLAPSILKPPVLTGSITLTSLQNVTTSSSFLGLFRRTKTVVKEVRTQYVSAVDINSASPQVTGIANNDEVLQLKNIEIGILNASVLAEIKKARPNISKIIKPKFFIKKVQEDYALEYYMKQSEVIGVVKEFHDCGFSLSATGEQVKNIILPDIDLTGMVDNHGIPITELYLCVVKKSGNGEIDLSDVESNFSKIISYTDFGHGLETVTEKHLENEVDELKIGDKMFMGLCEYDKETLSEIMITDLSHRVIHRDVTFYYKPFTTIPIKAFSSYVEDSNSNVSIPSYAVYSDIKQKYIWRDIYDIGFFENNLVGIDHKFLNGAFYIYNAFQFILNNGYTVKYKYNQNDINKLDGLDDYSDANSDLLTDILANPQSDVNSNKGYQEFKSKIC